MASTLSAWPSQKYLKLDTLFPLSYILLLFLSPFYALNFKNHSHVWLCMTTKFFSTFFFFHCLLELHDLVSLQIGIGTPAVAMFSCLFKSLGSSEDGLSYHCRT